MPKKFTTPEGLSGEFGRKKFTLTSVEKSKLEKLLETLEVRKHLLEFPQGVLDWLVPRIILQLVNDIKRERVFIFKDRQMILIGEEGSSLPETELDRQNIHDGEIGVGDRTLIESFIRQTSRNVVSLDSYQDRPKFRRKGAGEEYLTRLYYLLRLMGFEYVRCEATSKVSFKFFTERMKMRQISKVQNTILKRLLLADDEETQSHLYRRL